MHNAHFFFSANTPKIEMHNYCTWNPLFWTQSKIELGQEAEAFWIRTELKVPNY